MSTINPEVIHLPTEDIQRAVEMHPTPFYIYEEAKIRSNCRRFVAAFNEHFPKFSPLYAVKANTNPEILKIIFEEGWGADCSSEAEAWITKKLGGWGMYTGNYTTEEEFRFVQESGLLLNLDDVKMLETIEKIGSPEFISFRINPGITKGGMESLLFAGDDAKFGVSEGDVVAAYGRAKKMGVTRFGIHMMTGSNVLDDQYFEVITSRLLEIAGSVRRAHDIQFEYINIGGGFGVPYEPSEESLDIKRVAAGVRRAFDEQCAKHDLEEPILMAEPGRWVMADCGWLIGKVSMIKTTPKRDFVGIDAGMNNLPRPAIYGAYHHATIIGKSVDGELVKTNIVGRLCENNDQFTKDRMLPRAEVGDYVALHTGGAHAFSMGHNYNNRPRCAEYLSTESGDIRKIRRAETFEDLFRTVDLPS